MLKIEKYDLKINFINPILGSQPGKDTPASDYIREKFKADNPDADISDEASGLPEEIEKGTTMFYRKDNKPIFKNYQIKGMLKRSGEVLNGHSNIKAMRSKIDKQIFVYPRDIEIANDKEITVVERPLRAMTMKGERVSLARSECIAEGARIECRLEVLDTPKVTIKEDLIIDLLEYGSKNGISQWRNSGMYGQFEYELIKM